MPGSAAIGIGGVGVDRAVATRILEAVSEQAADDVRQAVARELEEARYEASLAERRHEHVDSARIGRPTVTSRVNWRQGGTRRSSVLQRSNGAWCRWMTRSPPGHGSIVTH